MALLTIPDRVRIRLISNRRRDGLPYYRKTRKCWFGLTTKNQWGYGLLGFAEDGRQVMTTLHRAMYIAVNGSIDEGLEVAHQCHNKACVNPKHLLALTPLENTRQTIAAGNARYHRPTHCPSGHPYEDKNVMIKVKDGRSARVCRFCTYLQGRRHATAPPRWSTFEAYMAHCQDRDA